MIDSVIMPITADQKGANDGPVPMGENQEKTTETAAAMLNGVTRYENSLAMSFSFVIGYPLIWDQLRSDAR